MDLNKVFSLATIAALIGLLVLHPDGAVKSLNAAGGLLNDYVKTVQGSGVRASG